MWCESVGFNESISPALAPYIIVHRTNRWHQSRVTKMSDWYRRLIVTGWNLRRVSVAWTLLPWLVVPLIVRRVEIYSSLFCITSWICTVIWIELKCLHAPLKHWLYEYQSLTDSRVWATGKEYTYTPTTWLHDVHKAIFGQCIGHTLTL